MNFDVFVAKAGKWITDNSPTILTTIGVMGTLGTAVLAGKASFKAAYMIDDTRNARFKEGKEDLDTVDRFKLVWTLYIPTVTAAGLTIAAVIGANRIGLRRLATMAALYSASEGRLVEYKDKVAEKLGVQKEEKIQAEVAQDRVKKNPPSEQLVIIGGGQVMCYDQYSARYFMSDMETLKQAEISINQAALRYGCATLGDFYDRLGLPRTKFSEDIGWINDQLLDLKYSTVMSDDNKPCIAIDYFTEPVRDFQRAH